MENEKIDGKCRTGGPYFAAKKTWCLRMIVDSKLEYVQSNPGKKEYVFRDGESNPDLW